MESVTCLGLICVCVCVSLYWPEECIIQVAMMYYILNNWKMLRNDVSCAMAEIT